MPELLGGISKTERFVSILVQQFCGILGVFVASLLVDTKLGRKYTISIPFVAAGGLSLSLFFAEGFPLTITFTSLLNFCIVMAYSALYTITPESYTTEVRNTGCGWANAWARVGGIIAPPLIGMFLEYSWGLSVCLIVFAGSLVVGGSLGVFLKETKSTLISSETDSEDSLFLIV